jgi:hypothetical protein
MLHSVDDGAPWAHLLACNIENHRQEWCDLSICRGFEFDMCPSAPDPSTQALEAQLDEAHARERGLQQEVGPKALHGEWGASGALSGAAQSCTRAAESGACGDARPRRQLPCAFAACMCWQWRRQMVRIFSCPVGFLASSLPWPRRCAPSCNPPAASPAPRWPLSSRTWLRWTAPPPPPAAPRRSWPSWRSKWVTR